jgi:hypothetical protein
MIFKIFKPYYIWRRVAMGVQSSKLPPPIKPAAAPAASAIKKQWIRASKN